MSKIIEIINKKLAPDVIVLGVLATVIILSLPTILDKFPSEQRFLVLVIIISLAFCVGFFVFFKDRKIQAIHKSNKRLRDQNNDLLKEISSEREKLESEIENRAASLMHEIRAFLYVLEQVQNINAGTTNELVATQLNSLRRFVENRNQQLEQTLRSIQAYQDYKIDLISPASDAAITNALKDSNKDQESHH